MNTNTRGPKMDQSFVMRVSNEDKAALKLAATERGMSVSALMQERTYLTKNFTANVDRP